MHVLHDMFITLFFIYLLHCVISSGSFSVQCVPLGVMLESSVGQYIYIYFFYIDKRIYTLDFKNWRTFLWKRVDRSLKVQMHHGVIRLAFITTLWEIISSYTCLSLLNIWFCNISKVRTMVELQGETQDISRSLLTYRYFGYEGQCVKEVWTLCVKIWVF